jgi:integrase
MLPSPANMSGGNLSGGKKKGTSTTPSSSSSSSSLVTPPPAIKKTHSGRVEEYDSADDDPVFQAFYESYVKDCERMGWPVKSDKVSSEQSTSSSKPKGNDLAFDHSPKKNKSERTFEDEDSSDDDFLKLYKSIEREKLSTEQSQSISNNSEAHARSLKKEKEKEKEKEEEEEEGSSRLVDGYIGMDGEWHPASEDDDDELEVEVEQEVSSSAAKSAAKEVRPFAAIDFMEALRRIIREGVISEDFLERLRHPLSIQMLKMMEKRNQDRLHTMLTRVRRQDFSVTVYIPDWVVPFLEAITKGRRGDELLFAGIGFDRHDKLTMLIKAACVAAGSEDVHNIGTHSGRKTFGAQTLQETKGDMRVTQQIMGHANILKTTLYTGQQPKHIKEVVRNVSTNLRDVVFGTSPTTTTAAYSSKPVERLLSRQNPVHPHTRMEEAYFRHTTRHRG